MTTFKKVKLGEVCDVRDGTHDSPKQSSTGYPLVTSKHILNSRVDITETYLISEKDFENINKRSKVDLWDILFSMIGTVGEIALIKNDDQFAIKNVGLIKTGDERLGKYLFYYLHSPRARNDLQSLLTGSTQKFISLGKLRDFPVLLPPDAIQSQIISVLSAYDDLIKNNEKRIKALEEMAQLLYTEWFVKFKFPGHEKGKLVDSGTEYGMVPEGWEVKRLREVTSVITKGTTPTTLKKSFVENGINFIKIESVGNNGYIFEDKLAKIDQETHDLLSRSKLQNGDVLFSIAGAIGRTARIITRFLPANTNQALAIIRPKEETCRIYLYQVISSLSFLNFSKGRIVQTAQANVSLSVLASAQILFPNREVLVAYSEKISPAFEMVDKIRNQNRILEKTRDLLIPQLVIGKRILKG